MILHLRSGKKWEFEWLRMYRKVSIHPGWFYADGDDVYSLFFDAAGLTIGVFSPNDLEWFLAEIGAERLEMPNCEVRFNK